MKRAIRGVCVCVFAAGVLLGQARSTSFEVASVKVSGSGPMDGEGHGKSNLKTVPGSLTMRNFSLRSCVQWAYNLKDYQVSGPSWIDSQRFDINAKAADPVKDDELRVMMQALLEDRFKLVFHREIKELPVYIMTVAKDGSKMKQSEGEGESNFRPVKGMGKLSLSAAHTSMPQLADLLTQPLQRPVVDQTGLKGDFDFTLDLARYFGTEMNQGRDGEGGKVDLERASVENAVVMAMRDQLGLQLSPKKAPIDMIVVDKAEKVPTEN